MAKKTPKTATKKTSVKKSARNPAVDSMGILIDPVAAATSKVARRLVDLCRVGKHEQAMRDLYATDARHVEAMEMPGSPYKRIIKGKATLLKMAEHWSKTTTVHSSSVGEPRVNADQFTCEMKLDATHHEGPMAGQRMEMLETCVYSVRNGKIKEARFFYGCQG